MKKDNRMTLRCTKQMTNGKADTFTVIIMRQCLQAAKKKFKDAGYEVKEVENA